MKDALYLALAYMRFHRLQTAALVAAVALILLAPLATRLVLNASEAAFGARAAATPLVVGARGGGTDLILNALYFTQSNPQTVPNGAADEVWDSGLAQAIPLHVRYRASGQPVVGATLDYFEFRGLSIASGRTFAVLGEAVLGAEAAAELDLGAGDILLTDPETLFDLTGAYPLELTVVGVLAPSDTPDDAAVFVDVKTAWVIDGIGHGHDDVAANPELVIDQEGSNLEATPAIRQFTRITPENIDSFHFHGDTSGFPLSAVLVLPTDARAGTILQGRYLESGGAVQMVTPAQVIDDLLGTLFRIGRILDAVALVAALAALIAIAVAVWLSLQLRRPEMAVMVRLGAPRLAMTRMLGAQIVLMLGISLVLTATLLLPLSYQTQNIALMLVTASP